MADLINTEITGLAELRQTLAALPDALKSRALKGMVATGASIIKNEAIAKAPMYTGAVSKGHPPPGTLKSAIYQTRLTQFCTPVEEVWKVDVRKGKRYQSQKRGGAEVNVDAYYASWVEYGTVKMGARPFMRPAFEAKKEAAVNAMGTYLAFKLSDVVSAARGASTK